MTGIKICGIKDAAIADVAVKSGANLVGFVVDTPSSPRNVGLEVARDLIREFGGSTKTVLVMKRLTGGIAGALASIPVDYMQFHEGFESILAPDARQDFPGNFILGLRPTMNEAELGVAMGLKKAGDMILIDGSMGSGRLDSMGVVRDFLIRLEDRHGVRPRDVILAGGLTPDNVSTAITEISPGIVDVSTGVERAPGVKDPALIQRFCKAVQAASTKTREDHHE